jgi:integrase
MSSPSLDPRWKLQLCIQHTSKLCEGGVGRAHFLNLYGLRTLFLTLFLPPFPFLSTDTLGRVLKKIDREYLANKHVLGAPSSSTLTVPASSSSAFRKHHQDQASSQPGFTHSSPALRSSHLSSPGDLQPSSLSLLAAMRGYSAGSFSRSRTSVSPLLIDHNSKFRETFLKSVSVVLKDSSIIKYNSHINGFRHFCIASGIIWSDEVCDVRVTLDLIASYSFYYVAIKPHDDDDISRGIKGYHSTNTLPGIYSALHQWAISQSRFDMNQQEINAYFSYIKDALPKIYPPDTEPRIPIRLEMLRRAWVKRGSLAISKTSTWLAQRDKTYFLCAHQGLFRTEELRNMRGSDIYFNCRDGETLPISVSLVIRDAKTSNYSVSKGEQRVHLPIRSDSPDICPVSNMVAWLKTLQMLDTEFVLTSDKTIWPVSSAFLNTTISREVILSTLRADMSLIGVPADQLVYITAHGLRTGGTCDYRDSGADPHSIIQHGRWSSEAYRRYFATSHETSASVLKLSIIPLADPSGQMMSGKGYAGEPANLILKGISATAKSSLRAASLALIMPPVSPLLLNSGSPVNLPPSIVSGPPSLSSFIFKFKDLAKSPSLERPLSEVMNRNSLSVSPIMVDINDSSSASTTVSVPTASATDIAFSVGLPGQRHRQAKRQHECDK